MSPIQRGGIIERKFSQWWAFPGSVIGPTQPPNATVNFSLASQSVDLLIGAVLAVPDNSLGQYNAAGATNTMNLARFDNKQVGDWAG